MLTEKDLKQIGGVVDQVISGRQLTSRSDLETLRTDLTGAVASKTDLETLKVDLKGDFRFLNTEIDRLDHKIDGAEQHLGKKIDGVLTAVDGLAQKYKDFELDLAAERSARERLFGGATSV